MFMGSVVFIQDERQKAGCVLCGQLSQLNQHEILKNKRLGYVLAHIQHKGWKMEQLKIASLWSVN
ncbi:hypothetical protein [Acinetobacter sp.]|uniref:hypothetical protein n=1 Tax=Acinetobacter sp. TaxID=472 RepID=UPI002FC5ABF9